MSSIKEKRVSVDSVTEESDDDDDLPSATGFLCTVDETSGESAPVTPIRGNVRRTLSLEEVIAEVTALKPRKPKLASKFTLDGLLTEHQKNAEVKKEMDDINQELKDDLKEGGLMKVLNMEDSTEDSIQSLPETQQRMLKDFHIVESSIALERPGMEVFHQKNYMCRFNMDVHPCHCDFLLGNETPIEKQIHSLTSQKYKRFIMSGMIQLTMSRIVCQQALLRWIFFIMSIHSDAMLRSSCQKILHDIYYKQKVTGRFRWKPTLSDIITVFLNYGAEESVILPATVANMDKIRDKLLNQSNRVGGGGGQEGFHKDNLILVLEVLAQILQDSTGIYTAEELNTLLFLLVRASLDQGLKNQCVFGSFESCIAKVVHNYTDSDWQTQRLKVCRMLAEISSGHHNNSHVIQLLPPTQRGCYLSRRVGYLLLQGLLFKPKDFADQDFQHVEIKDLNQFVPCLKGLMKFEPYRLCSIVTILGRCVGPNNTLDNEQRDQMRALLKGMRCVRVIDDVSVLDRTVVKDMMTRMLGKWSLDIQTMRGRQTKIFEYTSPVKRSMHTDVVATHDSDSDQDIPAPKTAKHEC